MAQSHEMPIRFSNIPAPIVRSKLPRGEGVLMEQRSFDKIHIPPKGNIVQLWV